MEWPGIEHSHSRGKDAFNRPRHGTAPDSEIFFQFSHYYLCWPEIYSHKIKRSLSLSLITLATVLPFSDGEV
jgi:hypothetical protein